MFILSGQMQQTIEAAHAGSEDESDTGQIKEH